MLLRGVELAEIPGETARVARAVFPKGCLAMRMRDALGPVFADADFAELFPVRGRPAVSPARLALVSVLQFAEGLTDRQTAHAVRSRLDWKYALSLELTDTGFDFSVLSEFRARLVEPDAGRTVFDAVLRAAGEAGLVKPGRRQRTDATHVLAATRDLNRLEFATTASASEGPGTYAVASQGRGPSVSASMTGAVNSPCTRCADCTSWANRRRNSGSSPNSGRITLMATGRPPGV